MIFLMQLSFRADQERVGGGGGGDITITHTYSQFTYKLSNESTRNYNYVHEYYSRTYLSNFRCIIIIIFL